MEIDEKTKGSFAPLFDFIKGRLHNKIRDVRASTHLKDSVACLSRLTFQMSAYMEKTLQVYGKPVPEIKRILDLPIERPVILKLKTLFGKDKDDPVLKDYSQLLLDIAIISEGGKLQNPARFSKMIGELMSTPWMSTPSWPMPSPYRWQLIMPLVLFPTR